MRNKIYLPFENLLQICLILTIAVFFSCNTVKQSKSSKKSDKNAVANKPNNAVKSNYSDNFYKEYSKKLGIELVGNEDKQLIAEITGWLNVPYKYGGKTKEGTDCSGLSTAIYKNLYNVDLYRSSEDQLKNVEVIEKNELKAGDLIFFKISGDKISHVGIYIAKGKFIHASTKRGVVINDLAEEYYVRTFYKCGRVIKKSNKVQ